jgi:hypothetical protein
MKVSLKSDLIADVRQAGLLSWSSGRISSPRGFGAG